MIERLLKRTLEGGFELISNDLDRLDLIFGDELTDNELASIKSNWEKYYLPVFRYGYTRAEAKLPMVRIALGNEQQSAKYLDQNAGNVPVGEVMGGSDRRGALWNATYDITIIANNGDVALVAYTVCRYLLMIYHNTWLRAGLLDVSLSGTELDVDPNYAPTDYFFRRIAFRCMVERNVVDIDSAEGRAWELSGATWNDEISGDIPAGIRTLGGA